MAPPPPKWVAAAEPGEQRSNHTATLLENGKVLIAGGYSDAKSTVAARAQTAIPESGEAAAVWSNL